LNIDFSGLNAPAREAADFSPHLDWCRSGGYEYLFFDRS
jgi:hypothetical protein